MINLAIVGYGGMAEYHAERLKSLSYYKLVGAYDIDLARLKAAEAAGLHAYSRFEDIAADKNVNAVLVATPNDFHALYAQYFAHAGKHVICEKPAAMSAEEYEAMSRTAAECGTVLSVHQNRRWDKDFLTVKKLYPTGGGDNSIGTVYRIESSVCGANGIPGGWRKLPEHGGGMMLDWGVHLIDQFLLLHPEPVTSIYCRYSFRQGFDVEDGFYLEAESGDLSFSARVDTNCFTQVPRWLIYGTDGTAIIRDWDLSGETVRAVYTAEETAGISAGNGFTKTMAYRPHSSVKGGKLPQVTEDNDAFYRNFHEAVNGAKQTVTHAEVLRVMKFMEACKTSALSGEIIKGSF